MLVLDNDLKDGEYAFYEDLGNGWAEKRESHYYNPEYQIFTHWIDPAIDQQKQEIEKLTRQIDIMQRYFQLIIDIGYDYDEYRKAENLMELIDELVEYAYEGKIADDHTCHMVDSNGNKYNILGEKIEEEDK